MPDTYESFSTATAQEDGPLVYEYPFAEVGDPSHFIASQLYRQLAADYAPPTLDATRTLKSVTTYCVGDSIPQKVGAGLVEFTRRWATIPTARNDYITLAYQFPGYKYNTGDGFANRGDPRCLSVPCRVYKEYFLCASGQTYTIPSSIPVNERQRFVLTYGSEGTSDVDYVLFSIFPTFVTSPTATFYQDEMVGIPGDPLYPPVEIIAEDSYIERYAGNIWCRVTKYIEAR